MCVAMENMLHSNRCSSMYSLHWLHLRKCSEWCDLHVYKFSCFYHHLSNFRTNRLDYLYSLNRGVSAVSAATRLNCIHIRFRQLACEVCVWYTSVNNVFVAITLNVATVTQRNLGKVMQAYRPNLEGSWTLAGRQLNNIRFLLSQCKRKSQWCQNRVLPRSCATQPNASLSPEMFPEQVHYMSGVLTLASE